KQTRLRRSRPPRAGGTSRCPKRPRSRAPRRRARPTRRPNAASDLICERPGVRHVPMPEEAPYMSRSRTRVVATALIAFAALVLAACSSTGGKAAQGAGSGLAAGKASTPHYTFAMITHAAPGDTFWDIIRKGEAAAAAKDNVTVNYSNAQDPTKQATLIQDAINSKVDGIAVTDPNPAAICPTIKKAVAAGIPVVMFNAGVANWQQCGGMSFFGQDESIAGLAAGKRLASEGAKKVLCVLQAQGQVQLEARCNGVETGLRSAAPMRQLYVNGESKPAPP